MAYTIFFCVPLQPLYYKNNNFEKKNIISRNEKLAV